jgi:hypothetical protein
MNVNILLSIGIFYHTISLILAGMVESCPEFPIHMIILFGIFSLIFFLIWMYHPIKYINNYFKIMIGLFMIIFIIINGFMISELILMFDKNIFTICEEFIINTNINTYILFKIILYKYMIVYVFINIIFNGLIIIYEVISRLFTYNKRKITNDPLLNPIDQLI